MAKLKVLRECLIQKGFRDITALDQRKCIYGKYLDCNDVLGGYSAILNLNKIVYSDNDSLFLNKHPELKTMYDVDSYNLKFMFWVTSNSYGTKKPELPFYSMLPIIVDYNFALNKRCPKWTHYHMNRILGELCLTAEPIEAFYLKHNFTFEDAPYKIVNAYVETMFIPYVYNYLLFLMTGKMIYPEYDDHQYPDLSKYFNYMED